MNKDTKTYLILGIIVIIIISSIFIIKNYNQGILNDKTAKCIAEKSVVYTQTGCSHCETQKEILGDYYNLFTEINCLNEPEKCSEAGITGTPTWIINGKKFEGVQTIKKLKESTGC